jgi:alpha-D-ribose 1-methylphosphonate 5-triphosphate synthase subunit PhnH
MAGTVFSMSRSGVLLVLLVLVAALGGPAAADNPMLQARVGENDSFAITLTDATGAKVTHLDPGDYTIQVNDMSDMHNFDLTGPGVSKSTGVADIGQQTWNVTFTNGTYKFVCDVHVTTMKGQFTVGVVAPTTTTQKLSGGVGPGAHISLTRSAKAGKAVLTIRDRSKKDNLHLTGPGVNKKTGVAFTGTVKWTVTLKSGTYRFRSDAHRALKGTLKVA